MCFSSAKNGAGLEELLDIFSKLAPNPTEGNTPPFLRGEGTDAEEFHAEPDGAPQGYAETYEKKTAQLGASGTLTAPFAGIHGWYWENQTTGEVTVTLSAAGFYNMSHEFRKDAATKTKMFP